MITRTRKEAAQFLRVSVRTMERLYNDPDGPPAIKVGRRIIYPDLESWLETKAGQRCADRQQQRRRARAKAKARGNVAKQSGSVLAPKKEQRRRL